MPRRNQLLVNGQVYHVFNKSVESIPIFDRKSICSRAELALWFYRYVNSSYKLANYLSSTSQNKMLIEKQMKLQELSVQVLAFCFMPNHFHLLIKQIHDGGISRYLGNFQNSFTRYYNLTNDRKGPIFLPQFKAVRVESDEQLIHVFRYIHLNPLTGLIIKKAEELPSYPWSSWKDYLGCNFSSRTFIETDTISEYFKKFSDMERFVCDQIGYQRELATIKHLTLD